MEILGVGPLEVLLIVLLALVLFGPKDIVQTARSAGRFLNRLYRSEGWRTLLRTSETLRTLPNRLAREAELDDLDSLRQTMTDTRKTLTDTAREVDRGLKAWTPSGTREASPPPPAKRDDTPPSAPASG